MKTMNDDFKKSSIWMKRHARPLECARWEYEFEGGTRDNVIRFLRAFQNEDGGFGHGLEPDFWLPKSSPMATWSAGQMMMEIGLDREHDLVQSMLKFLQQSYDEETGLWLSVLPENNEYPHAPWWHWKEGVQENWMYNPSAELAGFLIHWSEKGSEAANLGWNVAKRAIDYLLTADEMDHHLVANYQVLFTILQQNKADVGKHSLSLKAISKKITEQIEKCVDCDPANWTTGYKPLPLDFIKSPDDPLCSLFGNAVEQNLDFYVEQLSDEGTWEPSWEWGSYPEAFPVAKRYWQGILLINRYKVLKAFGLLE